MGDQAQTVLTLGLDQITKFIYRLDEHGPLVRVTYSVLTQIDYTEESEVSVLVTFQQRSLWIPVPADLRVLVLVSAHPKLRSFVRLCAWFILSLGPKPPLAHYPAFIVCLATTSFKK